MVLTIYIYIYLLIGTLSFENAFIELSNNDISMPDVYLKQDMTDALIAVLVFQNTSLHSPHSKQ